MAYSFDEIIERKNTSSVKYDILGEYFGATDIQPMWVADMDFAAPPCVTEAIQERANHPVYGYTIKQEGFYTSIVNWMQKRHQWPIQKEWISFSPGVVPALALLTLWFTRPGDTIIVQPPVYYPFFTTIKGNGRKIAYNPLINEDGRYKIDFDDLEQKAREGAKMIFLCSPHNPVGRVWTKEELKRLASICLAHDILMVSDEIHSDIIHPGAKHVPLSSLSEDIANHTITAIAPSKTFNLAGLSTSALIIPNKSHKLLYERALRNVHVGGGNVFGNFVLEAAYTRGEEWLEDLLAYLWENILLVEGFLQNHLPEIRFSMPEATYLLWLDCSRLRLDKTGLKNFFVHEAKVGLNDGPVFGQGGDNYQRMNIACPRAKIQEALEKIHSAMKRKKP